MCLQVLEGMEQRKQTMAMWTSAVENLRQRDSDMRHIRAVSTPVFFICRLMFRMFAYCMCFSMSVYIVFAAGLRCAGGGGKQARGGIPRAAVVLRAAAGEQRGGAEGERAARAAAQPGPARPPEHIRRERHARQRGIAAYS